MKDINQGRLRISLMSARIVLILLVRLHMLSHKYGERKFTAYLGEVLEKYSDKLNGC